MSDTAGVDPSNAIEGAAAVISRAGALLITAGAGMGVDSGLPDFRGPEGFWNAYPPYRALGLRFEEMANPRWFREDPALAWGFYGHRLNLYRATTPHRGFEILKEWAARMPGGARVFTSNVDGQFQRAGFPDEIITEVHGSIHHAQCMADCGIGVFSAEALAVEVDEKTFRAGNLPRCPACGGLARPNILMFGDWEWDDSRAALQHQRLERWLGALGSRQLAIVELGAGSALPTVRRFSELSAASGNATLVRINPREPQVPAGQIGIALGALEALEAIHP